jgi:hypothetical protein
MQGLESPPKAKAFGGFFDEDEDIDLVQKFQVKKTSSVCGGGRAVDVPSSKCRDPTCDRDNGALCDKCMEGEMMNLMLDHKKKSPENPNPPRGVEIDPTGVYGPRRIEDLGPCTPIEINALRIELWALFQLFLKGTWQFSKKFPETSASVLTKLAQSRIPIGFEGHENSCFVVMCFFIICFDKQIRGRIDTSKFAGFILLYIAQQFSSRLFVDRKMTQLFREEFSKLLPPSYRDFVSRMSCPNEFLAKLEEFGVIHKGPYFSKGDKEDNIGQASFVVNEMYNKTSSRKEDDGKRCDSFPEAISLAIGGNIPPPDSSLCFQFKEAFDEKGKAKSSGSGNMEFPINGFTVKGITFNLIFFTVIELSHYRAIFYLDGIFFHFNSNSPINEGHCLPVLTVLSEQDAMRLYNQFAHTVVFKCGRCDDSSRPQTVSETLASIPKYVLEETTWPRICKTFMCKDGTLVVVHSDGTSYVHETGKYLGKLTEPTIFVDPETRSFVEVVPVQQVAPVPQRLAAPVQQVAPVPQRLAAPVAKAQSRSQITIDDIRDGPNRWSCEGTSYYGRIEKGIHQQQVYIFGNDRYLSPQKLVDFLNFGESVNQ